MVKHCLLRWPLTEWDLSPVLPRAKVVSSTPVVLILVFIIRRPSSGPFLFLLPLFPYVWMCCFSGPFLLLLPNGLFPIGSRVAVKAVGLFHEWVAVSCGRPSPGSPCGSPGHLCFLTS